MESADFSLFVVTTGSLVRPHGISHQSFLVYLPNILAWFTVAFWTSRLLARLSTVQALVLGFCSSGYNFAIPSSRLHLTAQTLGITMRFAGNYALSWLSPQIDDMPVILKKAIVFSIASTSNSLIFHFSLYLIFSAHLVYISFFLLWA